VRAERNIPAGVDRLYVGLTVGGTQSLRRNRNWQRVYTSPIDGAGGNSPPHHDPDGGLIRTPIDQQ